MCEEHPEKQSADQPNESGGDQQLKPLKVDLRAASQQVAVPTEGLGMIYTRRPNLKMSMEICKRLANPDHDDSMVARIFMGCVSGVPTGDGEPLSKSLDEEQVAKLSDDDVRRLAEAYLAEVAQPPISTTEPIAEIARYARVKFREYTENNKKFAETIGTSLRSAYASVYGTADVMKEWNDRLSAIQKIGESIRSPLLGKVLERHSIPAAPAGPSIQVPRIELPPPEKTVPGRTMLAAEKSQASVMRMEEAMGLIVEQAGNVSMLIAKVIEEIEEQSRESQERSEKQTKKALGYARSSLVMAAAALVVSAIFGGLSYFEERSNAASSNRDATALIQQAKLQSEELRALIEQSKKVPAQTVSVNASVPAIHTQRAKDRQE